jgi:lipopolysaccharide export LptBFGC system permease protein LptF
MVIRGYFINGYSWHFVVILLMVIMAIILMLVVILQMIIDGYSINDY